MSKTTKAIGPLAYGIDFGGTRLRVALVDAAGGVHHKRTAPTDHKGGPESVLGQILALAAESTAAAGAKPDRAGISCPGPLDTDTGTIITMPTLPGWDDFPLRKTLAERLGVPVVLENDGIAAANGEWRFGAGRGLQHLVYVTVSTGIGGGVVADGRLLRGHRGMAGHVGHMILQPDGPRFGAGTPGSFEAMAAGPMLAEAARAAGFADAPSVVAAARGGNPVALAVMDREAKWLGTGFVSLLHLYSPQALIVGGGVGQALDLMAARIRERIEALALPPFRAVPVVPAALGDDAGLVGAAALAQSGERSVSG